MIAGGCRLPNSMDSHTVVHDRAAVKSILQEDDLSVPSAKELPRRKTMKHSTSMAVTLITGCMLMGIIDQSLQPGHYTLEVHGSQAGRGDSSSRHYLRTNME